MRVNQISDLHLEFADLELPGGDLLLLGGDVAEAKNIRPENYRKDGMKTPRRPDRYARFFAEEMPKYQRVLYIMGNHEHYGGVFDDTYDLLKSLMPDNVTVLEKEHVEIDGVIFIGAKLWTDLNNNDPLTAWDLGRNMNDYVTIKKYYTGTNECARLRPDVTYDQHKLTLDYIDRTVQAAGDKPCVVMTHHAPSRQSIPAKFQHDYKMNGGFASNLDAFIMRRPQIRHWTHGHMHDPCDYRVGDTQLLCNPRGYVGYETRTQEFDARTGFDI